GVNGSGKHNNWSLCTDKGLNLLKPGANPSQNYPFLLFFTAVLAALDEYFDLVRMSAATLGNESRLGGHEAPPTVISAFIGEDMQQLFDALLSHSATGAHEKQRLNTGLVADIGEDYRPQPYLPLRLRQQFVSLVGSSATLSTRTVVLNAAVSEMLSRMSDRLEKADKSRLHEEALGLACEFYERHKRIVFNGNGYSKEWFEEAEKRGLVHIDNSITAYDALLAPKNVALFEKFKIMNKKELESRRAIYLDNYEKTALIEARTMLMMAKREILPACMEWEDKLARDIEKLDAAGTNFGGVQKIQLAKTDALVNELFSDIEKLEAQIQEMQDLESSYDRCVFFRDRIKDTMDALRAAADSLETIVSRKVWPIPTYADILFYE
ncbi:MAG: glutamine synthetase type III, partial [Christensenellales bacterium]